jgi:hypothetical protein
MRLDVRDRFLVRLPVDGHEVGDDDGRGEGDPGFRSGGSYQPELQVQVLASGEQARRGEAAAGH